MLIKRIGDLFQISGETRAGAEILPVLSMTMHHGLIDQSDKFTKRVASTNTSNYKIVYKNELVVGFPIDEGVIGFQTKYEKAIVSPAYDVWKLKDGISCNIDYIDRYLRSSIARRIYASKMRGAVARRRSLKKDDFLSIQIPFPNLYDQSRISAILTRIEALITRRNESIIALDDLLKSFFLEKFGDPVKNNKGWAIKALVEAGSLDRGVSKHRPRNAPELLGGLYPFVQTAEVSNAGTYITHYNQTYSELGLKQSKLWKAGTLCITIAANIAKTGILTFDACFPDSVVGFVVNNEVANTVFIHHLFGFFQMILEKNAPHAAQKNINLEILRNLFVPVPPLPLQNQFAAIAEKVEYIKSRYNQSLSELENLYGSLSQSAFKGELNLITKEVNDAEAQKALIIHEEQVISTDIDQQSSVIRYSIEELTKLIKSFGPKEFDFESLMKKLENVSYDEMPKYDDLKSQIYEMLEGPKPRLSQTFDKDRKKIMLRAN